MKAIIVAGGKGTRLKPLTDKMPKPMIEVAGKPILEHIVNLFKKFGLTDFIFALCYLPEKITAYFGDGSKFGIKITHTFETEDNPMGTAGAIIFAKPYINDTFIVTYADILRKLNIKEMIKQHKKKKALATINVYKRFGPNPKSKVLFDQNNRVSEFIERPNQQQITNHQQPATNYVWANGSFYVFEPEVFELIPNDQRSDFGKDIFPKLLSAGEKIFAYPTDGYFIDIGNLEKLEKAKKNFRP